MLDLFRDRYWGLAKVPPNSLCSFPVNQPEWAASHGQTVTGPGRPAPQAQPVSAPRRRQPRIAVRPASRGRPAPLPIVAHAGPGARRPPGLALTPVCGSVDAGQRRLPPSSGVLRPATLNVMFWTGPPKADPP